MGRVELDDSDGSRVFKLSVRDGAHGRVVDR
jgi:hypothetical protein